MSSSTDDRVAIGYVRRAHGLRGDVLVRPLTDDPDRFRSGASLLTDESQGRSLEIEYVRPHNAGIIVKFVGVADRTAAEAMRGVAFHIDKSERRDLVDDEFWPDQLIGAVAVDPSGVGLGLITDVVLGEAQDRLVVTTNDDGVVEIPFVDALVGDVDLDMGRVTIREPDVFFGA